MLETKKYIRTNKQFKSESKTRARANKICKNKTIGWIASIFSTSPKVGKYK